MPVGFLSTSCQSTLFICWSRRKGVLDRKVFLKISDIMNHLGSLITDAHLLPKFF